jgi:hypothetical protein
LSSHPPFRLRLSLAFLLLALAGVIAGAAVILGSGQGDPTDAAATELAVTGPPLVDAIPAETPTAFEGSNPGMRLGVLDKDEAIREERQNRRDARALRALAEQQAAIYEYAAALDEAADAAPTGGPTVTSDAPSTTTDGGGGGGGGGGNVQPPPSVPNNDDDPLYTKLDNIATCESNQNPRAYNPQGPWYGAFQFRFDTWKSYGGGGRRGEDIFNYTYVQQREIAANLAQARGFAGSWPTCAARYGYS